MHISYIAYKFSTSISNKDKVSAVTDASKLHLKQFAQIYTNFSQRTFQLNIAADSSALKRDRENKSQIPFLFRLAYWIAEHKKSINLYLSGCVSVPVLKFRAAVLQIWEQEASLTELHSESPLKSTYAYVLHTHHCYLPFPLSSLHLSLTLHFFLWNLNTLLLKTTSKAFSMWKCSTLEKIYFFLK